MENGRTPLGAAPPRPFSLIRFENRPVARPPSSREAGVRLNASGENVILSLYIVNSGHRKLGTRTKIRGIPFEGEK